MITRNPYQQNGQPGFIADLLTREHVLPGGAKIDAALFTSADAVKVTVATGGAAQGATTVPVTALADAISVGTVLDFGGAKFARLTAAAAKGATSLTVTALVTALAAGDVAYYNKPDQPKRIAAGTLVGCTNAELEAAATVTNGVPAGLKWGPAADADDIVRFVVFDITDADTNNDVDLLRPGSLVYVNFVPNWAGLSTTLKNKVRATYELTTGATEV
jgi:hypothetical protein